jgi:hypothetical protein
MHRKWEEEPSKAPQEEKNVAIYPVFAAAVGDDETRVRRDPLSMQYSSLRTYNFSTWLI